MGSSTFKEDLEASITNCDFNTLEKLTRLDIYNDARILNTAITLNSIPSIIYLLDTCSNL